MIDIQEMNKLAAAGKLIRSKTIADMSAKGGDGEEIIQARFVGTLDKRRDKRIHGVLTTFDVWRHTPSGQRFEVDGGVAELMHSAVEWNEAERVEDGESVTENIFEIEDDKAERIASELRACGLVVTMPASHDEVVSLLEEETDE